jgi:hypothetical protein
MKKENALESVSIDKPYINGLIEIYGVIGAIHAMRERFTGDMNEKIPDRFLRIMVWQLTHSIEGLEEEANMTFESIADIAHFGQVTEIYTLRTMCNHILGGADNLKEYVKS